MIIDITRWGPGVFSYYHHWWIVPVIATHAGAVAGAWIYYLAIEVIVFVVVVVVVAVFVVVVVDVVVGVDEESYDQFKLGDVYGGSFRYFPEAGFILC